MSTRGLLDYKTNMVKTGFLIQGIREWTDHGSGDWISLRGLRPIAEIQYLDYLIYGLAPLSDDLATLRYRQRTANCTGHHQDKRTPFGRDLACRFTNEFGDQCLERECTFVYQGNMVQAAGMYNTLMRGKRACTCHRMSQWISG
jgi:hypothetical protein